MREKGRVALGIRLCLFLLVLPGSSDTEVAPRIEVASPLAVTDAAGRTVTLPHRVNRVATVGPVPVLNSFIFALGKGDTIVNGLPLFAQTKRHKFQRVFAPGLAQRPTIQGPGGDVSVESLMTLRPDVVFTMDKPTAELLERKGVTAVVLAWRDDQDVKAAIALLGKVFERQAEAHAYVRYFDELMRRVEDTVASASESQRPRVLFCSLKTMTQPHLIADWWIRQAGGLSVTDGKRRTENVAFSVEHLLAWNPDILIVSTPSEIEQVYRDHRLTTLKAVRDRRVYTIPAGAHPWGYRTAEQPLTVLWAAKLFHPDRFTHLNLEDEMKNFYERFFRYRLSEGEAREMLSGIP